MKTRTLFADSPCLEGAKWLRRQPDAQTAWKKCKRADWMIWALMTAKDGCPLLPENSKKIVEFAAEKMKEADKAAKGTHLEEAIGWNRGAIAECLQALQRLSDYDFVSDAERNSAYADEAERAICVADDAWCDVLPGRDFYREAADYMRELMPTLPEVT